MGSSVGDNLEITRSKDDGSIEDDKKLVLMVVPMQRWAETAWAGELNNTEGTGRARVDLDRRQMVQKMKVAAFVAREHGWLWVGGCMFGSHAADGAERPFRKPYELVISSSGETDTSSSAMAETHRA